MMIPNVYIRRGIIVALFLVLILIGFMTIRTTLNIASSLVTNKALEDTEVTLDQMDQSTSFNESDNRVYINHLNEGGLFELPVSGATGFSSIDMTAYSNSDINSLPVFSLSPGTPFRIVEEIDEWWKIEFNNQEGYLLHKTCFVNLPDLIPSIIYDICNTYDSKLKSSGYDIPNITSKALYESTDYNERFKNNQPIVPILYSTAKKISLAQQTALNDGNTLIIYEAFRPFPIQRSIVNEIDALLKENPQVKAGLTQSPWALGWFISQGISNHQRGVAIDVSLGKVTTQTKEVIGRYEFTKITDFEEYEMGTPIHELSTASVAFKNPVSSKSNTLWKNEAPSDSMNEYSLLLQKYCSNANLIPLASEWWHFTDLDSLMLLEDSLSDGDFYIHYLKSTVPTN